MSSVYKYSGESLADVVAREYGTLEALITVALANGIPFDDVAARYIELPDFTPEKPRPVSIAISKELEQIITVDSGQVLTDLSIQHYGTASMMVKLFEQFGGLIQPQAGQQLTMPVLEVSNKQDLAFFRNKRKVASATPQINVGGDMAIIAQGNYYIKTTSGQYLKFR